MSYNIHKFFRGSKNGKKRYLFLKNSISYDGSVTNHAYIIKSENICLDIFDKKINIFLQYLGLFHSY